MASKRSLWMFSLVILDSVPDCFRRVQCHFHLIAFVGLIVCVKHCSAHIREKKKFLYLLSLNSPVFVISFVTFYSLFKMDHNSPIFFPSEFAQSDRAEIPK